jgi:acyl-CoA reductase-like NAD-dependent aldehyde dehydrogenase
MKALKETTARFYPAESRQHEGATRLVSVIDDGHFDRLVALVEEAVASGARIEAGGMWEAEQRALQPTVLSQVDPNTRIMREEIFGPVLPVLSYRDVSEAVEIVRRNGKPLASYVFARDKRLVEQLLASFSAGATTVNNTLLPYASSALPFGGVGSSGIGSYHGYHGFLAFSHVRPVVRQREPALSRVFFPPHGGRASRVVRRLLRWLE